MLQAGFLPLGLVFLESSSTLPNSFLKFSRFITVKDGMETSIDRTQQEKIESARNITKTVYILQALGVFTGGLAYVVAVFVNHIKFQDVKGTWLESHFIWQIRTFWFSLLWVFCGILTIFFLIGFFILFANFVWVIYRITNGWLRFNDKKSMYTSSFPVTKRIETISDGKWF